jgi:serine protease Do
VLKAAASGGKIVRPWLGASGQAVTTDVAQSLGLSHPQGVLVKDVAPGSPAAQAGVRIGDVILALDGHDIDDPEGLRFRLATLPVNTPLRLALWRNGARREVVATVAAPPEQPPRQLTTLTGRHPLSGASIANINPAFADELGLDPSQRGVVVTALRSGSVADRLGLEPGDLLVSINKRPVDSVAQLEQLLAATPAPWVVTIKRGDKLLTTPPLRG